MHSVFTIVKKELRRSFTDIRVLLGMILPGLIIFLMYSLMGSIITGAVEKQTSYTSFIVRIENCPENEEFTKFFETNKYEVTDIYTDIDTLNYDILVIDYVYFNIHIICQSKF